MAKLDNFLEELKNSSFYFSDSDLYTMRTAIRDLHEVFNKVFSKPRQWSKRTSSVYAYKTLVQDMFENPDLYYSFNSKNVSCIIIKSGHFYRVGCTDSNLLAKANPDYPVDFSERSLCFSNGYYFIGGWTRDLFSECLNVFYSTVSYICDSLNESNINYVSFF
jgi:hypothetical protein